MNYKCHECFKTKRGICDVFVYENNGKDVVQVFSTDFVSTSTSCLTFTNKDKFLEYISFLDAIYERI